MFIRSNNDVIYIKQILKCELKKIAKARHTLTITYITGFELKNELTVSTLDFVDKDSLDIIFKALADSDNLEVLYIDIGKGVG